jgi:hypothetical protein
MNLIWSRIRPRLSGLGRSLATPWLLKADPRALAVCRLILFGFMWPGFHVSSVNAYASFRTITFRGVGILEALGVPLFSPSILDSIGWASTVTCSCALFGVLFAFTAPAAAVLNLYQNWVVQSSGKTNHGGLLFTCVLFVLAFSRASDAWSVDALVRQLRGKPRPRPSAAYRWPVAFIGAMVATQYGAAGLSKLSHSGWQWGLSGSLRWRLLSHQFTHEPPTKIGIWIARSPGLAKVLGTAALALEVSSPLSQLNKWAYRVIIPSLALLQFCIWLMMGVMFREMIVIFACLLPWNALLTRLDPTFAKLLDPVMAKLRAKPTATSPAAGDRSES